MYLPGPCGGPVVFGLTPSPTAWPRGSPPLRRGTAVMGEPLPPPLSEGQYSFCTLGFLLLNLECLHTGCLRNQRAQRHRGPSARRCCLWPVRGAPSAPATVMCHHTLGFLFFNSNLYRYSHSKGGDFRKDVCGEGHSLCRGSLF